MPTAIYMRPDEYASAGAVVTGTAADSTYVLGWLCDGKANRPARATSGTVAWTATFASGEVGGVVVANHNIDAGLTIGLGGAGSVAAPAARPNGIPYNAFKLVTPASAMTTLGLSVTSNSKPVIVGELIGGKVRSFPRCGPLFEGFGGSNLLMAAGSGAASVNPNDGGEACRTWTFSVVGTRADLDDLMAWFESERNGNKFSVFVPDVTINDAAVVRHSQEPRWSVLKANPSTVYYRIEISLREVSRYRWGVGL